MQIKKQTRTNQHSNKAIEGNENSVATGRHFNQGGLDDNDKDIEDDEIGQGDMDVERDDAYTGEEQKDIYHITENDYEDLTSIEKYYFVKRNKEIWKLNRMAWMVKKNMKAHPLQMSKNIQKQYILDVSDVYKLSVVPCGANLVYLSKISPFLL